VHPSFDTPTDTISDWLKVVRMHKSCLTEIFFFLKERVTEIRSFCIFDGEATVKNLICEPDSQYHCSKSAAAAALRDVNGQRD